MKLLIVAPLNQALPSLDIYAPVEQHCHAVAQELKNRGHEVIVVALQGGIPIEGVGFMDMADGDEEKAYNSYKEKLKDFDCILDFSTLKYPFLFKQETLKDLHLIGCVYPYQGQGYQNAPPVAFPCFVGTSDAHAKALSLKFGVAARVVNYGVKANSIERQPGDRMLFLGRFVKEKGPQVAIDLARQTRIGLDLAGEDINVPDQRFLIYLLQRCDGRLVKSLGRLNENSKADMISKAKCLILPYLSDDVAYTCIPAIEAISQGVPVVALKKGAIGEFIKDGVNGFLVERMEDLADAVKRVDELNEAPLRVMESAQGFTLQVSVDKYEDLIKGIVDKGLEW